MKTKIKWIMLVITLTLPVSVMGQVIISLLLGDKLNSGKIEFGLDGGVNYSSMKGLPSGGFTSYFNLGFYFDIKTKNPHWLVHTGVIVKSTMGAGGLPVYSLNDPSLDNAFAGGRVERRINYFNVPICVKYVFDNHFYLEGGIMPALRYSAHDIFTADVANKNDLTYERSIKDELHQMDFGLIGGIGYRLMGGNGMNLTLRYYLGLVDVVIDDSSPDQYNTAAYLTVGIPIGAGKAREREEKQK